MLQYSTPQLVVQPQKFVLCPVRPPFSSPPNTNITASCKVQTFTRMADELEEKKTGKQTNSMVAAIQHTAWKVIQNGESSAE